MVEIAAAIIGVLLATIVGLIVRAHRSLVTYEIVGKSAKLAIEANEIVAYDPASDSSSHDMAFFEITIINRGWKGISNLKIHAEGIFSPVCIEKRSSSISPETIIVQQVSNSLEISAEYFPKGERLTVSFVRLGWQPHLHKLTGAGSTYKVESIHFYKGQQDAIATLKRLLIFIVLGALIGVIIGDKAADDTTAQLRAISNTSSIKPSK